jgi:hypothetical protein
MELDEAAVLISLIAFFLVVGLYLRQNGLEEQITEMEKSRKADEQDARRSAVLTVTHHSSGGEPKGYFLLHNAGRAPADEVILQIRSYASTPSRPLIEGGVAAVEHMRAGERVTIDTDTVDDGAWPVEALLTWKDAEGPQSTAREVSR